MEKSFIGEKFHGMRVEVIDEEHESGYNMLKVYGYGYKHKGEREIYLGKHDVIELEHKNSPKFCIDSTKPNSEFEIRIDEKMFELIWNSDSIRFKVLEFGDWGINE